MRPTTITQSGATGNSPWVPVSYNARNFAIGLGAYITSGASLTYSVQHTFDDPSASRPITIARAATTATVTDNAHALSVGDSITVKSSGSSNLDGTYDIASIVDANTYTYTVANSGATADQGNAVVTPLRVYTHATITGQTGRIDGNYAFPIQALRLRVTVWVSGAVSLIVLQSIGS